MNNIYETLEKTDNSLYNERETGLTHSAFSREYTLFRSIQAGDVEAVRTKASEYLQEGITMGNLSDSTLRGAKYWAVSTIAVAVHYAILGGMDETDAFNLSDEYIRHIDSLHDFESIVEYLLDKSTDLTYGVFNARANLALSPAVRRAIHYIHIHLHEKITADSLAKVCGLSRSYFSTLFKSELHISIHQYILREKLNAATIMLSDGDSLSNIAYKLSFASESHFISCYKKYYGVTPRSISLQKSPSQ